MNTTLNVLEAPDIPICIIVRFDHAHGGAPETLTVTGVGELGGGIDRFLK